MRGDGKSKTAIHKFANSLLVWTGGARGPLSRDQHAKTSMSEHTLKRTTIRMKFGPPYERWYLTVRSSTPRKLNTAWYMTRCIFRLHTRLGE